MRRVRKTHEFQYIVEKIQTTGICPEAAFYQLKKMVIDGALK
ncbi:hypothetical protein [Paenibacillus alvei]|nr:hypothetical protein [Paenibacillus alvei]